MFIHFNCLTFIWVDTRCFLSNHLLGVDCCVFANSFENVEYVAYLWVSSLNLWVSSLNLWVSSLHFWVNLWVNC